MKPVTRSGDLGAAELEAPRWLDLIPTDCGFWRIVVASFLHGTLTTRETPRLAEFTVSLPRYG